MKYLSNKNGFLGIDNKFSFKEKAVIVPFGLEKTVSYGGGTKNGPKEIIKASHQVELYDEELNCEPYKKIGIKTLKPFKIDKNIKKALNKISNINKEILNKKLFPMTLGGEHSITPGCIVPFTKKYKKICLLHFDAHADLISVRIAIGSGVAFITAQLLDIQIFDRLRKKEWFVAPLTSSLIGSTVDTFLFFSISFYATGVPWVTLSLGDLAVKVLVALIMLIPFRMLLKIIKPIKV